MNIGAIARRVGKTAADNAPTILTALGVTGAITTAVLTGKATFKAAEILYNDELLREEYRGKKIPTKEVVRRVWPQYVPAVSTGVLTVASIIASNHISTRRAAALASAYTVSQQFFKDYKDKVVETIGKDKEQKVRDEVAKDRVLKNPPPKTILLTGKQCWVYDEYTGNSFVSSYDELKQAEIDINFQIIHSGYASLSDFWDKLGVTHAAISDEIGWNTDAKLELEIGSTISEDNVPVLALDFRTVPVRGYGSSY